MSNALIVLALDRFGQSDGRILNDVLAEASGSQTPLVAVAYGAGDVDDLAAICVRAGVAFDPGRSGLSFGAAANAGVRSLNADAIVVINGCRPMNSGWLRVLLDTLDEPKVGVVGPLVTDQSTSDTSGLIVVAAPQSPRGFDFQSIDAAHTLLDCDALRGDCLVTTRAIFDAIGGFDEAFGCEHASIDYCLRVGQIGQRVIFQPETSFIRALPHNAPVAAPASDLAFDKRWSGRVETHENYWPERTGTILRREYFRDGVAIERVSLPAIALLAHGPPPTEPFIAALSSFRLQPASAAWADADAVVRTAREMTELRGPNYVAFVRTDTGLTADTLNDLVNAIERAPGTAAAVLDFPADGRCVLVAPRLIPQHLRIEQAGSFDASLAAWLGAVSAAGRSIARVTRTATVIGERGPDVATAVVATSQRGEPFVSIVMLSWNAPEYTEVCIDSIRERTKLPHEIIVVDNGSRPETVARLRAIPDIRVIYNASNMGFAYGCNQGLAAACGTHLVLLNNDVVVTDNWLEPLITVQQNHPTVGCSAPRSNEVAGQQRLAVTYRDLTELQSFAAQRSIEHRGVWSYQSRVIGLCMCLNRRVIVEIGGLDTNYGTGNFEDDDYSMRIRAAGYEIAMCDDSFIHHFGSVSFRANEVDYDAAFFRNKARFAERWQVMFEATGYDGRLPARRGFLRERDYVALPPPIGVDSSGSIARG